MELHTLCTLTTQRVNKRAKRVTFECIVHLLVLLNKNSGTTYTLYINYTTSKQTLSKTPLSGSYIYSCYRTKTVELHTLCTLTTQRVNKRVTRVTFECIVHLLSNKNNGTTYTLYINYATSKQTLNKTPLSASYIYSCYRTQTMELHTLCTLTTQRVTKRVTRVTFECVVHLLVLSNTNNGTTYTL